MPTDFSGLPFSGGILLAGLIYAGASMLITGPTIGERVIEKSDWLPRCERVLQETIILENPAPVSTPRPDCSSLLGALFGADGAEFCGAYSGLLSPLTDQIERQERNLAEANQKRIELAASRSTSRCSCAENMALENRIPWALYAGSFRLVTPSAVRNLDGQLMSALSSPLCTLGAG
jgi:hypothetical protein